MKKDDKKKVTVRLSELTINVLGRHFKTRTGGAEYWAECFPTIMFDTLKDIKQIFSKNEMFLLVEAFGDIDLNPHMPGMLLTVKIEMSIHQYLQKYNVDRDLIINKVKDLSLLQAVILEIFLAGFFQQQEKSIEEYIKNGL